MQKLQLRLFQLLMFLLAPLWLFAQVNVSGTVTNNKDIPVEGASVRVKNSNLGTATNASGKFNLTLPGEGGALEISSIGLKSQTVQVSSSISDLVIKMEEEVGNLEEVIITGLASSIKRANIAHAVGK